jgi:hypothetical protein
LSALLVEFEFFSTSFSSFLASLCKCKLTSLLGGSPALS